MPHFIVRKTDVFRGTIRYQYPRRNTGQMYKSRTTHGKDIEQARVFNTKTAAKNSSKGWGEVIEVKLGVVKDGT